MAAKLFCKTGQLAGSEYQIDLEATIGSKSENTIVLYPKVVSGKHARIFWDEKEGCYYLEDLGSRNGTLLDGVPVHDSEKLGPLHVITFAKTFDFIFQVVGEKPPRPREPADVQKTRTEDEFLDVPAELAGTAQAEEKDARKTVFDPDMVVPPNLVPPQETPPVPDVQKTVADAEFVVPPNLDTEKVEEPSDDALRTVADAEFIPSPEPEAPALIPHEYVLVVEKIAQRFKLKPGENIVGRALECDICVDDPSVSRRHACLTVEGESVKLKDLKSKNHTFVKGERIRKEIEINPGTEITFGEVYARLEFGSNASK